jgi:hypothetical protein
MIAEVEMDEEPEVGMRREGGGIGPVNRAAGGGLPGRAEGTAPRPHQRASVPISVVVLRHMNVSFT